MADIGRITQLTSEPDANGLYHDRIHVETGRGLRLANHQLIDSLRARVAELEAKNVRLWEALKAAPMEPGLLGWSKFRLWYYTTRAEALETATPRQRVSEK